MCSIFNIVKDKITVKTILINYFSFKAAPYGWYVGMYMGLYLMIPFLNKAWNGFEEKSKKIIITCLFLIVIIPSVFNTFNFDNVNWLYGTQESYTKVVDEYWTFLYPVFYFFIGKYIYEFSKNNNRYNKKKVILLLILACTLFGFINYFKNYDYFYPFTKETSYSGYQSVVISCLITMLVLNTNIKNTVIKKGIYILSKYTLGTYLISYIFDVVLYYIVKHIFNNIAGLSLVLPFTILVYIKIGITGYFVSMFLGIMAANIYMLFKGKLVRCITLDFKNNPKMKKECISYCFPTIFTALAWWINSSLDKYFVTGMLFHK